MNLAVRYMLIANFTFALMQVCIKLLPRIPVYEIVFFRGLVSLILCYIDIRRRGLNPLGTHRGLLLGRGVAGTIALTLFFYTLKAMPLASAATIQYLSPVFTILLATLFLREPARLIQWPFFILAFGGVALIKGFDPRVSGVDVGLGMTAAFFSGVAYTFVRALKGKEDPMVVIFVFPLIVVPTLGTYSVFHWVAPQGVEWVYLIAIGLLTQIAQVFMTRSYQMGRAANVAHINYIGSLYALGFGYFIFNESLSTESLFGLGLVLFGVMMASHLGGKKRGTTS